MKPQTIIATFDPAALPQWAQQHPEVVSLCESDLSFRANVYDAKTAEYRKALIREAHRRSGWSGARNGAGRKPSPEPIEQHTITFYKSHVEYLESLDPNLSKAIRKLIDTNGKLGGRPRTARR